MTFGVATAIALGGVGCGRANVATAPGAECPRELGTTGNGPLAMLACLPLAEPQEPKFVRTPRLVTDVTSTVLYGDASAPAAALAPTFLPAPPYTLALDTSARVTDQRSEGAAWAELVGGRLTVIEPHGNTFALRSRAVDAIGPPRDAAFPFAVEAWNRKEPAGASAPSIASAPAPGIASESTVLASAGARRVVVRKEPAAGAQGFALVAIEGGRIAWETPELGADLHAAWPEAIAVAPSGVTMIATRGDGSNGSAPATDLTFVDAKGTVTKKARIGRPASRAIAIGEGKFLLAAADATDGKVRLTWVDATGTIGATQDADHALATVRDLTLDTKGRVAFVGTRKDDDATYVTLLSPGRTWTHRFILSTARGVLLDHVTIDEQGGIAVDGSMLVTESATSIKPRAWLVVARFRP